MNLRYKVVSANLFGLVLPFVFCSIVLYTGAFDNVTMAFIYLSRILIPFLFLTVFFSQDSLMKGVPRQTVFLRTVMACIVWAVAVGLESQYRDYIALPIAQALEAKLPLMNSLIPAYFQMYFILILIFDIIFLTLAICLSHCGKNRGSAGG